MVSRLDLFQATIARLEAIPSPGPTITVFRGEIPARPPMLADQSRRIAPYVVAFAGAGNPLVEPDLGDSADELDWPLQLVVAAGFEDDLWDAADRVHAQIFRWSPVIAGAVCGTFKPPRGYDSMIRRFDSVDPIRFELPLQYRLTATVS